jgi:hypothetical protein
MVRKFSIILTFIVLMAALTGWVLADDSAKVEKAAKHDYVGAKKCKVCHKKDGIHPSWLETKHAKAWETLKPEQQKDKTCVGCHSTGTTADGKLLEGVQCEACHGAGADYKKKSIMADREKSVANGLLLPDEKTCLGCHNENVPEEFRSKEKFDYAKMKEKGVHAAAVKVEKKK